MGNLSRLRHIALHQLKSAEKADQPLLKGLRGERQSAFEYLTRVTSLELGGHSFAPVTNEELQGISHLTNLQDLTFRQLQCSALTCSMLTGLSQLTSFEMSWLQADIRQLTRLQRLAIISDRCFYPFPKSFSSLSALTALAISNTDSFGTKDISSLTVFSNLQSLTLTGVYGKNYDDVGNIFNNDYSITRLAGVWASLVDFPTVKHLELNDVIETRGAYKSLAGLTQLTCLHFYPKHAEELVGLSQDLARLSTLTNLDVLRCKFSFLEETEQGDYADASVPVPDVGAELKAALPQASSMSCFAIESERLQYDEDAWDEETRCGRGLEYDYDGHDFRKIKEYWVPREVSEFYGSL